MAEVIVFPDAVAAVAELLRTAIPGTHTAAVIPKDRKTPENLGGRTEFVTLTRTGGVSSDKVVDNTQITVDSYAGTGAAAHDLAQLVRAHLHAAEGTTVSGTQIYGVSEFGGPSWIPDSLSGHPRYRQTFQVGVRGTAI